MGSDIAEALSPVIIRAIQDAYFAGKLRKTNDCVTDMDKNGLYEADVEKVISEMNAIYKTAPATSPRASHINNTHYSFHGVSTKGVDVFCKIASDYHPKTGDFMGYKLTSFCNK
jgi:hypothetical protein